MNELGRSRKLVSLTIKYAIPKHKGQYNALIKGTTVGKQAKENGYKNERKEASPRVGKFFTLAREV